MCDVVHEVLERLRGIFEAKRHPCEFKESEGCGDRCLRDIFRTYGDLVVALHEVDFRKDLAPRKAGCEVMNVRDGVCISGSALVERR